MPDDERQVYGWYHCHYCGRALTVREWGDTCPSRSNKPHGHIAYKRPLRYFVVDVLEVIGAIVTFLGLAWAAWNWLIGGGLQ